MCSVPSAVQFFALPQYTTWSVETQAKKKIELLKEHCTLIEKFKMDKQLEYDEWAKKVQPAGR